MEVMPFRSCGLGRPLCVRRLEGIDRLPALKTTAIENLQGQLLTTVVAYLDCMSDLNQPLRVLALKKCAPQRRRRSLEVTDRLGASKSHIANTACHLAVPHAFLWSGYSTSDINSFSGSA